MTTTGWRETPDEPGREAGERDLAALTRDVAAGRQQAAVGRAQEPAP